MRQQNERPLPPSAYDNSVPGTVSAAVLRALEGDPARRYASAGELAEGLRLGLRGEDVSLPPVEEATPTRVLGGETATRRLERTERRPVAPAATRPAPRRRQTPPPAPAWPEEAARRGAFSRFARFVAAAIALVLIAAAVAAAVIAATDQASGVKATEVAGTSVDRVVEELKELVKKNTK